MEENKEQPQSSDPQLGVTRKDPASVRDAAAIFGLSGVPLSEVDTILVNAKARRDAKESAFIKKKADVLCRIQLLTNEIERIEKALAEIEQDKKTQLLLDAQKVQIERDIQSVELLIRLERLRAERTGIQDAIEKLEREREAAQTEVLQGDSPTGKQRRQIWQENLPLIESRVLRLRNERDELDDRLAAADARVAEFNSRYVTKTVAGFLLWAGYGSLAATGAVLGHLFGDGRGVASAGGLLVSGAHDAIQTMQSSWHVPNIIGVAILIIALVSTLWLILAAFKRADKEVTRFDDSWKNRRDNEIGFTLPNPDIRRSSYTQMIAALPFVFVIGTVICFLAAGNNAKGVDFSTLIGSVTDTFIGTSIGLLCTSIMILYVLRAIEPRGGFPPRGIARSHWRDAWEFYALPALLLLAITLAAITLAFENQPPGVPPNPGHGRWLIFGAFMLLSTVTLAYGVVFHGVFKDAAKLTASIRKYDMTIEALTFGPGLLQPAAETLREFQRVTKDYRLRRERLEALARSRQVGEALGHEYFDSAEQRELDDYLETQKRFVWFRKRRAATTTPAFDLKAQDLRAAALLSERFARLSTMKAELGIAIGALTDRIKERSATATEAQLLAYKNERTTRERELNEVDADRIRILAELDEQVSNEKLDVRRAYELGSAARPAVEAAKNSNAAPPEIDLPGGPEGGADAAIH